jgi:hypothetical protein
MPQVHRSPLSEQDMDTLEALAAKANAHGRNNGYTPLYVALDVGDSSHRDGYLLLAWPALNSRSAHCARLIFDYIAEVVAAEFGATMTPTAPQGKTDGRTR